MATKIFVWILTKIIRAYQVLISPIIGPTCKYYPCCSSYMLLALQTHGVVKGTILGIYRLIRCNPFSSGGVDMVPEKGSWSRPVDEFD